MSIILVRHGRTDANASGLLQGHLDRPLDELGQRQAEATGRALAAGSHPVTGIVASPLLRTRETAEAIAVACDAPVTIDERWIELDYGDWDGIALADVPAESWAAWRVDPEFAPPGGERLSDVTARVRAFCTDLVSADLVIAVSHVSPIKAAVCNALQVDQRVTWRMQLEVAAVTRIGSRPDGSPYLSSFNDASFVSASNLH